MSDGKAKVGAALRFLASGGWTDQDPDAMSDLLRQARKLAVLIAADEHASREARELARSFLAELEADTFE